MDIKVLQEKFCEYEELMNWFHTQGILRTDNLVGSYAEYLLADKLNLELCNNSSKDVDATETVGNRKIRYQIKSRRLNGREDGLNVEFGSVSISTENPTFDYLLVLVFSPTFEVDYAYKIPYELINMYSVKKSNGKRAIILNEKRIKQFEDNDDKIEDIKKTYLS